MSFRFEVNHGTGKGLVRAALQAETQFPAKTPAVSPFKLGTVFTMKCGLTKPAISIMSSCISFPCVRPEAAQGFDPDPRPGFMAMRWF